MTGNAYIFTSFANLIEINDKKMVKKKPGDSGANYNVKGKIRDLLVLQCSVQ